MIRNMTRTQLLAATALGSTIGFLVPGAAAAAESTYDWSGFYAGLGLTGVRSTAEADFTRLSGTDNIPGSVQLPALGDGGTIRFGENWQAGRFVYGVEADGTQLTLNGYAHGSNYTVGDSLSTLLSLRARFGMTFDRLMVYGTTGLVLGQASFRADIDDSSNGTPASASAMSTGALAGLGVEVAVTDHIRLTVGADYYAMAPLHGHGVTDSGYFVSQSTYSGDYTPRGLIFETGVNLHF